MMSSSRAWCCYPLCLPACWLSHVGTGGSAPSARARPQRSAPRLVYSNPPLVGVVLLLTISAAVLALWLDGRLAAQRAGKVLLLGLPLLVVVSAYWLVPSVVQLPHAASCQMSSTASWAWTEGRAALANGLWLNTTWGWTYPEYYPYAHLYTSFPLALVKYLLPAAAFASLVLNTSVVASGYIARRGRLIAAAAALALFLIVLGTGTNAPGAFVFDLLYHLPFGWLLQQPGRFLMAAGLAYGILVAGTIEAILQRYTLPSVKTAATKHLQRLVLPTAVLGVTALLVLAPGFPLASGAIVPTHRPDLPSAHVRVPTYWTAMAGDLNGPAPPGNLLVLPPDDFYQMPYKWGYYGTDGFIANMTSRHVLDPVGQGYFPASSELLTTVQQVAASLLAATGISAASLPPRSEHPRS